MRQFSCLVLVLCAACTRPAQVVGPRGDAAGNDTGARCTAGDVQPKPAPQPEPMDLSSALATEESALIACMSLAQASDIYVTFVIDETGRARDVTVDGSTQGGAARCIRRALQRVSLRGARACPTTGEFILSGVPGRTRGPTSRAWLLRARQ